MKRALYILLFTTIVIFLTSIPANACPTCGSTICLLGKDRGFTSENQDKKWYFRYLYEQVNWHVYDAAAENVLVKVGHDLHDKIKEEQHHFELGRYFTDDLNVFFDIPYVVRSAEEIADADNLGAKQRSQGWGDLQLIGDYRLWHNDQNAVSVVGGVKIPTGATHEKNFQGERFETDMQPGGGALDYIFGGIYKFQSGRWGVTTNASYVFTTEGAQGFQFGDLFTASAYADYLLNPNSKYLKTRVGLDTVYQDEKKEIQSGEKNPDMGGRTVFVGPAFRVQANEFLALTGNFLHPVVQDLNGLSQKLDYAYTLGGEVRF